MCKLSVRVPSIIATEVREEAALFLSSRDEARMNQEKARLLQLSELSDSEIVAKLDELREEVIVKYWTASQEAVDRYEELVKLLTVRTDRRNEFDQIWGLYGLVWEMEMGLDA